MTTATQEPDKLEHARQNAIGWAQSISEMVAALNCDYDRLEELKDERADLASEAEDDTNAVIDEAREALRAWDEEYKEELDALIEAATIEGTLYTNDEEARQRVEESPLSVEVRSGWTTPGSDMEAEEFCVLLSTGGPALRIRGELDEHQHPRRAWLEMQDWFTSWTEYHGPEVTQDELIAFCSVFYFGG